MSKMFLQFIVHWDVYLNSSTLEESSTVPDRSGVYLQCHAVHTAGTLHPMQCTCSIGCSCTCSVRAAQTAATLQLHCLYTPLRSGVEYNVSALRNCNKSLDILVFYLLPPGCRTINLINLRSPEIRSTRVLKSWGRLSALIKISQLSKRTRVGLSVFPVWRTYVFTCSYHHLPTETLHFSQTLDFFRSSNT